MTATLQRRLFRHLVFLLVALLVVQTGVYTFIEYRGWKEHPEEPLREELNEVVEAVGLNLLLLPFLIGLSWWLAHRMIAPVRTMAVAASRISSGQFSERIDTGRMPPDEMRSLAETLNAAFGRYQAAVRRLERFSGDAAHQLRTPIAAMRAVGEVAVGAEREGSDYRRAIEDMLGEVERLSALVEQLLELSRLESGALRERFERTDSGAVTARTAQVFVPVCEERGITLECGTDSGLVVMGIEALLVELIANLVDNAIRHTPQGGVIRIGALRRGASAVLYVHDSGPGIPAEYAQAVFERFAQIPGGRQGRAGLGLALAADIAAAHGGSLAVANPGQPGARFECVLPLAQPLSSLL